jgi:hypothetical protein
MLKARLKYFERLFQVGDIVIVTETVAGQMVLVRAVASELE